MPRVARPDTLRRPPPGGWERRSGGSQREGVSPAPAAGVSPYLQGRHELIRRNHGRWITLGDPCH